MSERMEQEFLAAYLDDTDLLWCHVPNGGHRIKKVAAEMKRQGQKPGVPDVLIFTRTPGRRPGIAIELKRPKGSGASKCQKKWLKALTYQGWLCYVCHGHREAIEIINHVYGNRRVINEDNRYRTGQKAD